MGKGRIFNSYRIVNDEECADYDKDCEVAFSKIEEAAAKLNKREELKFYL